MTTTRAYRMNLPAVTIAAVAALSGCATSRAPEGPAVVRLPLVGSDFPISAAVSVRHDADTYFLSGALPPVINKDAPKGSVEAYGNMQTQTVNVLKSLQETLGRLGLGMGDVVKMTVFMVGDPGQGGKLDFAGLMAGYTQFFGTAAQPNKPARSAVQVAALVVPGPLLEIEVVAAKGR
jgi:enamine deaminase RidA (YjgF/YER057c/UK114 family)